MNYLQNHCWCSDSNWGGQYDCRHMVSFTSYKEHDKFDWDNVITHDRVEDVERYELAKELTPSIDWQQSAFMKNVPILKPEVLEWLHENVEDTKDAKGWCIGSLKYRMDDACGSFAVFFQRRKDSMAFIKRWSTWKKPVHYCQYFTDVRKQLNLDTLKYEPYT